MADAKCQKDGAVTSSKECVVGAFDDSGGGIAAGQMGTLMYGTTLGIFLLIFLFAVLGCLHEGNSGSVEERQAQLLKTIGIGVITLVLLLLFIGVVIVVSV